MRKEKEIQLTIETQAVGDVLSMVPYNGTNESNEFTLEIPNKNFLGVKYTHLDLTKVVANDVECFQKLNKHNDKDHQVYTDTLCIYGVKISGSYIRIQYWFDQFRDDKCHRMCDGVLTHYVSSGNRYHEKGFANVVYPECYSKDCCVYW